MTSFLPAKAFATTTKPDERPHYLRPALEIGAGLAAASAWYALDRRNVFDWDRPSARQRFNGEAWRFDNNPFPINFIWHPLSGSGMYALARGNRLGVWSSFAYALAGSSVWEFAIEFNEKVSISDLIATPGAGLAIGEFAHKLALAVTDDAPLLGWTFGLSVRGHRRWDGLGPLHTKLWKDLSFVYGFGVEQPASAKPLGAHFLAFGGCLSSLPGYRAPGGFRGWYRDADISCLNLAANFGARGLGVDLFAETRLVGYEHQDLAGSLRHPSGISAGAALGVAYLYRSTEAFGFDDRQGLVLFPGVTTEVGIRSGKLRASAALRAYPTFGGMSAPSYSSWRAQHPMVRTKTVLQREGYSYGVGLNSQGEARLGFGPLELRGQLSCTYFSSIEGSDRSQELVQADPHGVETALDYGLSAWVNGVLGEKLAFGGALDGRLRKSEMAGVTRRLSGMRMLLNVRWRL